MSLLTLFRSMSSASVARKRLQALLNYERDLVRHPDLVSVLREDILTAIGRHVTFDPESVQIKVERDTDLSLFAMHMEIPNKSLVAAGVWGQSSRIQPVVGRSTIWTNLTGIAGAPDNGTISVTDATGAGAGEHKTAMYVDSSNSQGTIAASVKNVRVPNPTDIVYVCIDEPEAAAYVRGGARLANGEAVVSLPDHFVSVVGTESMTVQVTPLSADSLGLAVIEKAPDHIIVRELHAGNGNYDFDWEVKGVRKDYENSSLGRAPRWSCFRTVDSRVGTFALGDNLQP
jgi:cell division topological specificity factor